MVPIAQRAARRNTDGRSLVVSSASSTITTAIAARNGTVFSRKVFTGEASGIRSVGSSTTSWPGSCSATAGETAANPVRADSSAGPRSSSWGASP